MARIFQHTYYFLGLTLLGLAVAAFLIGPFAGSDLLVVLLAMFVQLVLRNYRLLYSRMVPLERLRIRLSEYDPPYSNILLQYYLALTPFVVKVHTGLGILWVVGAVVLRGRAFWVLFRRTMFQQRLCDESRREIGAGRPQVVAYMSGPKNVGYQINQWIPVLEALKENVIVLVRERAIFDEMPDSSIPVYFARRAEDVEVLLDLKSVRTVLYPANPMKNLQALRHFRLDHFFINHGESDKAVNQSKVLLAYDKLLVGGQLAERRLSAAGLPLRPGQVVQVGRPQTELFLEAIKEPRRVRTILYAPTWEGFVEHANYSSIMAFGLVMLERLIADGGYTVLLKPHPYTGVRDRAYAGRRKQLEKMCDGERLCLIKAEESIYEAMNRSDLLIADISSVLNEFLATNKPIVVCNVQGYSEDALHEEFPSTAAAYRLDSGAEVGEVMDRIQRRDDLWRRRQEVRRDSLGDFPEGAVARFQAVIRESVGRGLQ